VVKKPYPITQEHRHQVKPEFIKQDCLDALISK
jgi:hypothetical protein